ncbi:integrase core domain-containing protein [Patescibacteria group bacterium]|nr:integrase core domain-containing protein [Patescibacteria group bacterium]
MISFLFFKTDNGSEFLGDFKNHLTSQKLKHWFIYPRCPRINGCVERYNRTIQEEFVNSHLDLLVNNLEKFNRHLADYLVWYNCQRVHKTLKLKTPLQHLTEQGRMSKMSVTYTDTSKNNAKISPMILKNIFTTWWCSC